MLRHFYLVLCATSIASCAKLVGPVDPWREGRIRTIVNGSQLDQIEDRPCVARVQRSEIAELHFAEVTYPHGRFLHYRTLPLPEGSDLKKGDEAWFEIHKCTSPSRNRPEEATSR